MVPMLPVPRRSRTARAIALPPSALIAAAVAATCSYVTVDSRGIPMFLSLRYGTISYVTFSLSLDVCNASACLSFSLFPMLIGFQARLFQTHHRGSKAHAVLLFSSNVGMGGGHRGGNPFNGHWAGVAKLR